MNIEIRKAVESDSEKLFALMRELAIFEKYIDVFAINPDIVLEKGFRKTPPDFYSVVAIDRDTDEIAGMAVYYFVPYTARNETDIYLKELYVKEKYRGNGLGNKLMQELKQEAIYNKCGYIKWGVAPWNEAGIKFYENLGATENKDWLDYELKI